MDDMGCLLGLAILTICIGGCNLMESRGNAEYVIAKAKAEYIQELQMQLREKTLENEIKPEMLKQVLDINKEL